MIFSFFMAQALGEPLLKDPDIFGDKVVFCCESDLWLGNTDSGSAVRLTSHEGDESDPRFSPDGKWIAFSAFYDGFQEVYVVPSTGGAPRRVTYHNDYAMMMDWTPDGKNILYRARNLPRSFGLYTVPIGGGFAQKLPLEFAAQASYSPDGNRIALTRLFRYDEAWFRYQGGQKNDIWIGNLDTKEFKKFHAQKYTSEYPVWAGDKICWLQDGGNGTFSVVAQSVDSKSPTKVAGPYPFELRSLQTDGKSLIYEKAFSLEMVPVSGGGARQLTFNLVSDAPHILPFRASADAFVKDATLGPTGNRVYVETRGQVVSLPAKEGDARVILAKPGVRYRYPRLSPDTKSLLYFSDESGEQQMMVANADGTNPKQITTGKDRQLWAAWWSPDSKWIAYWDSTPRIHAISVDGAKKWDIGNGTSWNWPRISFSPDSKWLTFHEVDSINQIGAICVVDLEKGEKHKVSTGISDDQLPMFSADGSWLAFVSKRNISVAWDPFLNQQNSAPPSRICLLALRSDVPSPFMAKSEEEGAKSEEKKDKPPFKIELEGLYSRVVNIPVNGVSITDLWFAGDRLLFAADGEIQYYDLKSKSGGAFASGALFEVSNDGSKVLIVDGNNLRVVSAAGEGLKPTDGRVSFGKLQLNVDPQKEWRQIFWDAWRFLRDYFYVKNMHGNDWPAIGKKYEAYLSRVRSRPELDDLLRWLQSELSTGHMFATSGDSRSLLKPAAPAFLGLDAKPDASGFYRIEKIFRGDGFHLGEASPFAEQGIGVKEGDFLIEVAGVPAKVGSDFMRGLVDRAGQVIQVKVNSRGSTEGARSVYIKPLATERPARLREWVRANREMVNKLSDGKIGYIHLRSMVATDMADFIQQYFTQRDKDALIMDLRFNSGGNISNNVATVLKQQVACWFNMRGWPAIWTRQGEYFPGPMVCMMNEFNASNGEEFPHQFKQLGLGPLIGKRTWGGEVGSDPSWPLIDGGTIAVPAYGAFTMKDGWIIEGTGVSPDIEVDNDPTLFAKGRDMQIERAVTHLMDAIKKHPIQRPVVPPPPIKLGGN